MPLDHDPKERSAVDAVVAALRMRDVADSPEIRVVADQAVEVCRRRVETVLFANKGSVEAAARELKTTTRTLHRLISDRYLNLSETARRIRTERSED